MQLPGQREFPKSASLWRSHVHKARYRKKKKRKGRSRGELGDAEAPEEWGATLCLQLYSLRNTIKSSLRGTSLFNGWLTLIEEHRHRRVFLPSTKCHRTWEIRHSHRGPPLRANVIARLCAQRENRRAHARYPWLLGYLWHPGAAPLSVSSIVLRDARARALGEFSDAWHVPGGPRAPLNRTPISNEHREESPRAPRMRNATAWSEGGWEQHGEGTAHAEDPSGERYAVAIIFCYPLSPPARVSVFSGGIEVVAETSRDQSRSARA